jgi:hypothetical protein
MAAITAHRSGIGYVLALDRSRLAFDVAEHELSRIGKIAESQNSRSKTLVRHMAAYVTLCQGLTRDQAEQAIEAEARALRYVSVGDPPEIYKILHAALTSAGANIAPILPDVVGEAAILLALGDGDLSKARESMIRAAVMAPELVPAVIIRMAQDFGGMDGRPVEWFDYLTQSAGPCRLSPQPCLHPAGARQAWRSPEGLRGGRPHAPALLPSISGSFSGLGGEFYQIVSAARG